MSTRRAPRLAVNPIAYWMRGGRMDRSRVVLEEAFNDFRKIGYQAVKADVPPGMTPDDFLDPASRVGMSYVDTQLTKRLWTEPGYGVVDFDAVRSAMPADYDGDYMIEVDEPSIDDRFESSRRSHEWAMRALPFLV